MSYFGNYFKNYAGGWWGGIAAETIFYLTGVYKLVIDQAAAFKSIVIFSGLYQLMTGAKSAEFEQIVSVSGDFSNLLKFGARFDLLNTEYGIFE